MYDKSKFNFSETFNNGDGKTSGSGFIRVYLGLIAGLGFIAGIFAFFFHYTETMEYFAMVLKLVAASTILMGVRKLGGQIFSGDGKPGVPEKPVKPGRE